MPWLDTVPAVLQVWFGGQEVGDAIADMLFGDVEPGGRLPQTFPARLEDHPAVANYPGTDGHVAYEEGIFIGYRHYDTHEIASLYPFGHGLGYTTFTFAGPRVEASAPGTDATITLRVDVTNTGSRRGKAVVQAYVRDVEASIARPRHELKGFATAVLDPAATATVDIVLDRRAFAWWDVQRHAWVAEAGEYELEIGRSSCDITGRAVVRLAETVVFKDPLA
jgi:beta-glucosidase